MKFYSEKLGKLFETEDELLAAEKKYEADLLEAEQKVEEAVEKARKEEEEKEAKKAALMDELKALSKKYHELEDEFCKVREEISKKSDEYNSLCERRVFGEM